MEGPGMRKVTSMMVDRRMPRHMAKRTYLRWVVLASCAVLYCWIATHLGTGAYDGAPDESMRALVPQCIAAGNLLPSGYDECAIYEMGYWSYAFYPQLLGSYVSALCMAVAKLIGLSANAVFMSGRLASVLFGLLAVHFVGKTIAVFFANHRMAPWLEIIAMVMLGYWPQVAFLSSYMNNDIVAFAGVAILFYALANGMKYGWDERRSLTLASGVVVCTLGYANSYGFVLVAVIAFIYSVTKQNSNELRRCFRLIMIAASVATICILPFISVNIVRYHDPLGMSAFHTEYERWVAEYGKELQQPWKNGLKALLFHDNFVQITYASFIGTLGLMTITIPFIETLMYSGLIFIGAGLFISNAGKYYESINAKIMVATAVLGSLITIALHLYYAVSVDYQAQGRYVIYLLVPLILMTVMGLGIAIKHEIIAIKVALVIFCLCYTYICIHFFMASAITYGWYGVTNLT